MLQEVATLKRVPDFVIKQTALDLVVVCKRNARIDCFAMQLESVNS